MEKLKFRAWDKEEKRMIYDTEHDNMNYWDGITGTSVEIVNSQLKSECYHWMQYTGLKDKTGKEIFEGDIVNVHHFSQDDSDIEYIAKIEFSIYCGTQVVKNNGEYNFVWENEYGWHEESLEVIGNIYQNPDLLNNK